MADEAVRVDGKIYLVSSCEPGDLSKAERAECAAIIEAGGAVRRGSIAEEIEAARLISLARLNGKIVGVGAIKRIRKPYAEKIAFRSGVSFSPETPELGYVAIDPEHQGEGLSHRLAEELVAKHSESLFATTSSQRMIATLTGAELKQKGHQWPGQNAQLSFWWKDDRDPKDKHEQ
ncbi:MAG TPA: GNAT family N-acetyltransferase [Bradyrhizobium sp.]|nr:GNAT family N-acetyltransferase [Bradyrhizobium sp.]